MKTTIFVLLAIILILSLVEQIFKPRIDFVNGSYILWYGRKKRKFIKIFTFK